MLDLQAEQHDHGQSCPDLYEAVLQLKRRHDLHPCAVRPRDGLALRRDSEREMVQDLVKRFRDLLPDQQRHLPALLNSLAQLEVVVGDLESGQHDFAEVARLVADPLSQAEAHHNVYRAALERRDWTEALAALRRAVALDAEAFEPFPFAGYEPERILGAGGFGTSFLCRERTQNRPVVVKALRSDSLDRDAATLFREMHTLQDLDHPALVRVHDCACVGGEEPRPYLVLEYVEGQTLAEYVAQHGPLSPEDWLEVCWPVARALQAAHGRGILHRSLRSAAVLVRHDKNAEGATTWRVKLLDTGLSLKRALIHAAACNPDARAQTTLGRSVARTLAYAPVEVVARPKGQVWVGPHSDIYSFGKLSAFALTGRADPDAGDLARLPEPWRQLLADCTAWTTGRRPEHFGVVLDRLSQMPGAGERVRRIEHDLHAITIAEHTAALEVDPDQVTELVNRGNAYARQGDFDRAIADFTRAIQLRPGDASLYRRRALVHSRNRALDAAIADCTEALRLEPRNLEAHTNRGLAYAQKNDHDRAIADYTEALRLKPRDTALLFNRGNAYHDKGDYERAVADYTEAIRLDPRNLWAFANRGKTYLELDDYPRAAADFTRVLQLNPNDVHALADRAEAYTALGQHDKALADYTTALALDPGADLYFRRGLIHLEQGQLDQGLVDLTEAITRAPEHESFYLMRGEAYADRGDFEKALADFDEAIRRHPLSEQGWRQRGRLHVRQRAYEQALADYTRAIELKPDRASLWFHRGTVHAERGEWEAAIADYTEALRLHLGYSAAHAKRGDAYCHLGDGERALTDYTAALKSELDADDVPILCNRAGLYARLGDHERALADYTEVLRLDPANARARNNRGNIRAERGDYAGALADYTEALRLEPNDLTLYHNRGRIYALLGDIERALADNLEALRRNPDDARTCNNLAWLWATSPRPEHRDHARAVEYARRACELTQWQNAGHLDTLAAACAAAGQFAEAIEFQRRAIALAGADEKTEYRSRLELYEAGRAYEPPA
jgi:tetratricopeptide (TPR) repeat protein